MNKLLLLVILFGRPGSARGQKPAELPLDNATHRICYAAVVPVAGSSRAQLLARARAWATLAAPAGPLPVAVHEPATDVLLVTGARPFSYTYTPAGKVTDPSGSDTRPLVLHYTARLALRQGRYRYELTNFVVEHLAVGLLSQKRLPAEAELFGWQPLGNDGAGVSAAFRAGFLQATARLVAQLQDAMRVPSSKAATE
jgi:hypothetical protein